MSETMFKVFRGEGAKGELCEYSVEVTEGMVVLDAINQIQARQLTTLRYAGTAKQENADRAVRK